MFRRIFPIIGLSFVNIIGYSLLIPILPGILRQYIPENQIGFYFGFLISAYSLFQFFAAPFWGGLSDKFGRKPILLISQGGTCIAWLLFAIAYFIDPNFKLFDISISLIFLLLGRVLDGLTDGNISVSNAWIADITKKEERAEAYGILGGVFGIGILAGPVLGGISTSTSIGYLGAAILGFLTSFISALIILYELPESLPKEKRLTDWKINYFDQINIFKQIGKFKNNTIIKSTLWIRFFFSIVFASFFTILLIVFNTVIKLPEIQLGLLFAAFALITGVTQIFILPKVQNKIGDLKSLIASTLVFIIGLSLLPIIPIDLKASSTQISTIPVMTSLFFLIAFITNLGISLSANAFKTIYSKKTKENEQGLIQGIDESLIAFGNGVTPLIAGIIYTLLNIYSFWFFGILLFISLFLCRKAFNFNLKKT